MAYTKGTNYFVDSFDTNVSVAFVDSAGLAYFAKCTGTPPTTASLYQVGCIMIQTDGTTNILWSNVGTSAVPSWIASGSSTGVQYTNRAITSAEILSLFGTAISIVAAPGVQYAYVIDGAVLEVRTSSTAYTNGGGVTFAYANRTQATSGTIAVSVLQAAAGSQTAVLGPLTLAGSSAALFATKNSGIVLCSGSEAYLAGTGTATAHVWYRKVKVVGSL